MKNMQEIKKSIASSCFGQVYIQILDHMYY